MSYASDQLYNGYLRTNMPRIVTTVKPREIVVHLPCLTAHDRETIEAKRETCGSFDAMVRLLDCLKRRENWPEQFIAALEACEHRIIAAEIRAEYDALRGINNSNPPTAPPAANVVAAHVHPAPSAPHLPDPGTAASAQPAQDVQSEQPVIQPIQKTEEPAPESTPAPAPVIELTTPPEQPPVQTKDIVVPPVTPPPSPDSVRASSNPSPSPVEVDFISHQEPVEDLEPESLLAQDVPNETVNVHQEAKENTEIPQVPEVQVKLCDVDDRMQEATVVDQVSPVPTIVKGNAPIINAVNEPVVAEPEPVTAAMEDINTVKEAAITPTIVDKPAAVEASPGRSVSPLTNLDDLILTPEKPPVQETSPLEEKSVVPAPEKASEPQNTQVVEIPQTVEVPPRPCAELENGGGAAYQGSVSEDDDIFLSKPGVLLSVEPSNQNNTTICPPSSEFSGDNVSLQMSDDVLSCQENGIALNKPDKEVSEEDDIQENVGHLAEEPSILNKEMNSQLMEDSDGITKEFTPPIAFSTLISDPVEDAQENILLESSMNQKPLMDSEDPATDITAPATTMISETTSASPPPSLDMDDVRENIGHVAEDPSILNLVQPPSCQIRDGESDRAVPFGITSITNVEQEGDKSTVQTPLIQVNGEPAQETPPVSPISTPSVNDNEKPIDPKQPGSVKRTSSLNSRYILTAAGVGACALLIAWRFKH